MDFLILKYLDILIGLAVVMLMGSVLVTAVTQFVLAASYARARYLRDGLASIIQQLDRKRFPEATAQYVASRLLRNPIVGRAPTVPGKAFTAIRNWVRWLTNKPALPAINPTDVIQREELVLFLLQWAAGEGLLLTQGDDEALEAAKKRLEVARTALASPESIESAVQTAMARRTGSSWPVFHCMWRALGDAGGSPWTRARHCVRLGRAINGYRYAAQASETGCQIRDMLEDLGVADPADALRSIRALAVKNERESPDAASRQWFSEAISATVSPQFLGRVNTWFDNVVARVSDNFSLEAKVWASVVALLIAVSVQLDSVSLLKRLEVDDKLRATLVQDADRQAQNYEEAQKKLKEIQEVLKKSAEATGAADANAESEESRAKQAADLADNAKTRIAEQLAVMREPKFAIVPNYFIWQPIAQFDVLEKYLYDERAPSPCNRFEGDLQVDAKRYGIAIGKGTKRQLVDLATAIRSSGAPVTVWQDSTRLRIVAATPEIVNIRLERPANGECALLRIAPASWAQAWPRNLIPPGEPATPLAFRFQDLDGLSQRWPGILLSFVLLSLGGPFWFNILKKALNFRSVLAMKDDDDRKARQTDQKSDAGAASS